MTIKQIFLKTLYEAASLLDNSNNEVLKDLLQKYYHGKAFDSHLVISFIRKDIAVILLAIEAERYWELRELNLLRICELCDLRTTSLKD